jgi:D-alanyl-D-alanine carboxypeptidase
MNYDYKWTNEVLYSNFKYFDDKDINSDTLKNERDNIYNLYPGECPTSTDQTKSDDLMKTFVDPSHKLTDGFVPKDLVDMSNAVKSAKGICLEKTTAISLAKMFAAAKKENINLGITSGYRTPKQQQDLFDFWVRQSGLKDATEGVAKPYYSEHQLGVAADLTGESINYLGVSNKFNGTIESEWLKKNAYLFGFTLSYPKDKKDITKYIYEPWHYRYVGLDVAKILNEKQITFTEYQSSI